MAGAAFRPHLAGSLYTFSIGQFFQLGVLLPPFLFAKFREMVGSSESRHASTGMWYAEDFVHLTRLRSKVQMIENTLRHSVINRLKVVPVLHSKNKVVVVTMAAAPFVFFRRCCRLRSKTATSRQESSPNDGNNNERDINSTVFRITKAWKSIFSSSNSSKYQVVELVRFTEIWRTRQIYVNLTNSSDLRKSDEFVMLFRITLKSDAATTEKTWNII